MAVKKKRKAAKKVDWDNCSISCEVKRMLGHRRSMYIPPDVWSDYIDTHFAAPGLITQHKRNRHGQANLCSDEVAEMMNMTEAELFNGICSGRSRFQEQLDQHEEEWCNLSLSHSICELFENWDDYSLEVVCYSYEMKFLKIYISKFMDKNSDIYISEKVIKEALVNMQYYRSAKDPYRRCADNPELLLKQKKIINYIVASLLLAIDADYEIYQMDMLVEEASDETLEEEYQEYAYENMVVELLGLDAKDSDWPEEVSEEQEIKTIEVINVDEIKVITDRFSQENINKTIENFIETVEPQKILLELATIYPELCKSLGAIREYYLKLIKDKGGITERQLDTIRKDLNNYVVEKQPELQTGDKPPYVMTEEEKEAAIKYLRRTSLIEDTIRDCQFVGGVLNEEANLLILHLSNSSRKYKKPISTTTFAQSSAGKNHVNNAPLSFVPPEDLITLSSGTKKSLDYSKNLKHKILYVFEVEGIEELMPTVRIIQSEGKLRRAVVAYNSATKSYETVYQEKDTPCVVSYTTTLDSIHNENSTRIFEIYVDESQQQTAKIVSKNLQNATIENLVEEDKKKELIQLHQNMQRLLVPYKVTIPYCHLLTFPAKSTRHRRDSERFRILIELFAYVRQFQKTVKTIQGIEYIEADLTDYIYAYNLSQTVFHRAFDNLSLRSRAVLQVITDLVKTNGGSDKVIFTYKNVTDHGNKIGKDFNNLADLEKQFESLQKHEYIERVAGSQGKVCKFKLIHDYLHGDSSALLKELVTPKELAKRWKPAP